MIVYAVMWLDDSRLPNADVYAAHGAAEALEKVWGVEYLDALLILQEADELPGDIVTIRDDVYLRRLTVHGGDDLARF